jgi:hypothetical protein
MLKGCHQRKLAAGVQRIINLNVIQKPTVGRLGPAAQARVSHSMVHIIGMVASMAAGVLVAGVPVGFEGKAQQAAYCRSMIWESASTQTAQGILTSYFTTYVNVTGTPLFDAPAGRIIVSQELRRIGAGSEYRNDFILYSGTTLAGFGSTIGQFPATDADLNGVPDVVQIDRAIDSTISGNALWRAPQVLTEPYVGRVTRSANSASGVYSARFTTGAQLEYSGTYRVVAGRGDVFYRRGTTNSLRLSLQVDGAYRAPLIEGLSAFVVNSRDMITIQATELVGTDGYTYRMKPAILRRDGDRYSGEVELEDGEPLTSWRDFIHWHFVITDPSDFDRNGVPDLSDDLIHPPAIQIAPTAVTVSEGESIRLSVAATGTAPLRFQWQKNGENLPNGSGFEFRKDRSVLTDTGFYRVIVTNAAGRIETDPVRVTVMPTNDVPQVIGGPFIRESSGITYYLLADSTWPSAITAARKLGGYLATVPDRETLDWLVRNVAMFDGLPRAVWVGLSDHRTEGVFEWDSGSASTYRNWTPGEPNNCCEGEPYVGFHADLQPDAWNDYGAHFRLFGMVEVYPPQLRIQTAVELTFPAPAGKRFQLQVSETMAPPNWRNDGSPVVGVGNLVQLFRSAGGSATYYRLLPLE